MFKILITDKLAQQGSDIINSTDGFEAVVKTGISEDELASIIGDYEGLIIRSGTKVTAKVLQSPGKLKGIARAGVGVDNIDIPEATRKGVIVMAGRDGQQEKHKERPRHDKRRVAPFFSRITKACGVDLRHPVKQGVLPIVGKLEPHVVERVIVVVVSFTQVRRYSLPIVRPNPKSAQGH